MGGLMAVMRTPIRKAESGQGAMCFVGTVTWTVCRSFETC